MILIDDKNNWNKKAVQNLSFLQSWEWGELQKKLGKRIFRTNVSGLLASVIEQRLPLVSRTYLYVPHGPIIESGAASDAWLELAKAAGKMTLPGKPVFLRVEPLAQKFRGEPIEKTLTEAGFRQTKPVQPQTTLVIDLQKREKEILEKMEHDTRYSIRTAEKRGVVAEFSDGEKKDFETFWKIFSETNKRHGLRAYPKAYYEGVAKLSAKGGSASGGKGECSSKIALAKLDNKAISAALFVYFGERVFYLFAGSSAGYGRFNAPTYLLWQTILEAKKAGYRYFDFWGISHENKNWEKITAFKKSFGGEEIASPGAWDYVYNQPLYFAYNLAKRSIAQ